MIIQNTLAWRFATGGKICNFQASALKLNDNQRDKS